MIKSLFCSLDTEKIAADIRMAEHSVCYAAPGIQQEPARAIVEKAKEIGPELIVVSLDFDERVIRMGFGDINAVKTLLDAGITINSTPGLRTGLLIVDHQGYIFTPIALYLESDSRHIEAPNAMRLSEEQAAEALARLSPAAKAIAIAMARTEEEKRRIKEHAIEVHATPLNDQKFTIVNRRIEEAPPMRFDVARQVRVFTAYLQYVELELIGASIQRHRIVIPPELQELGSKDLNGRLRTTFDLIEKDGKISSKALEKTLNDIRKKFTPSLGTDRGRVVLKAAKPHLDLRLAQFREDLKAHQENVEKELQGQLDASRKQIIEHFVPYVKANPPDDMRGQFLTFGEEEAKIWLEHKLEKTFPKAEALIQKMNLEVRYKDVTFETLNTPDFLKAVKEAFPYVNWDQAYDEFYAAGENRE